MNHKISCSQYVIVIFLLNFFLGGLVIAQKENNIWYFGDKAGLDFNNSPPIALTNSAMNSAFTCGSISDVNGDLLFYTNGREVWNKNHSIMSNGSGLYGDTIIRQSGYILQTPGNSNEYYIFSINSGAINYSVVDINLNGGLGAVTTKNSLLISNTDGTLAISKHSDCNRLWLITRIYQTNQLRSFLIQNSGISSSPVVSSVGTVSNVYGNPSLRVSPNNKKLAGTLINGPAGTYNGYLGYFEIYDFNNATGVVSNPITVSGIRGPFGIEFSPNNLVLYGTSGAQFNGQLYQYDLSLPTDSDIINSEISIDSLWFGGPWGIQLSTDGKIYVMSEYNADSIGIIYNPNNIGTSCNYVKKVISLNSRVSGTTFPNAPASTPQMILMSDSCESDSTQFSLLDPYAFSTFIWNFGDSSSGSNNSSSFASPKHKFTGPGFYPIRFIGVDGCFQLDTILDTVYIEPLPLYDLGNDTSICYGDTFLLDASFPQSTYVWQDSTTDSTFKAFLDTIHYVEVTNGCGSILDTIAIDYRNFDDTDLGNDTSVCPGDSLLLDATTPYASHYLWQNSSTGSTFLVTMQGSYNVEVGNGCDILQDSIDVFYINPPAINLGNDTSRCSSDSIFLDGNLPAVTYLWYNGDTNQIIVTTDTGYLWVKAFNFRCSATDSIYITIKTIDVSVVKNGITLTASVSSALYQWINCNNNTPINGANNQVFKPTSNGNYAVIITQNGCADTSACFDITGVGIVEKSFSSRFYLFPNPTTGEITIELVKPSEGIIEIYNSFGSKVYEKEILNESKLNIHLASDLPNGVYLVKLVTEDSISSQKLILN